MVQFLSINFFSWISSIFVGFFKSSHFFVSSFTYNFDIFVLLVWYQNLYQWYLNRTSSTTNQEISNINRTKLHFKLRVIGNRHNIFLRLYTWQGSCVPSVAILQMPWWEYTMQLRDKTDVCSYVWNNTYASQHTSTELMVLMHLTCKYCTKILMFVCPCIVRIIRNWRPTRCNFLVYLFVPNQLYKFRAMFSPIIRSHRLAAT